MKNVLDTLAQQYAEIASNSVEIESHYYHDVLTKSSYQKISKGSLLNIRPFETQLSRFKFSKELKTAQSD